MVFVIINPNSTASMTETILAGARAAAPGVAFEGWTSDDGPPSIQGPEDGALAVPPLLDLVDKAVRDGADGVIIGCFDDTGLADAVMRSDIPVMGIGQAAFHMAALRLKRFSVVTSLAISIPVIEANIRAYGFGHLLGRVRDSGVPVLEIDAHPDKVAREAGRAVAEDGIGAIVLGCAGMAPLACDLTARLKLPVIDGVAAAARLCPALTQGRA